MNYNPPVSPVEKERLLRLVDFNSTPTRGAAIGDISRTAGRAVSRELSVMCNDGLLEHCEVPAGTFFKGQTQDGYKLTDAGRLFLAEMPAPAGDEQRKDPAVQPAKPAPVDRVEQDAAALLTRYAGQTVALKTICEQVNMDTVRRTLAIKRLVSTGRIVDLGKLVFHFGKVAPAEPCRAIIHIPDDIRALVAARLPGQIKVNELSEQKARQQLPACADWRLVWCHTPMPGSYWRDYTFSRVA